MKLAMSDYAKMTEAEREEALTKLVNWAKAPRECVDAYRRALDFIEAQEWAGCREDWDAIDECSAGFMNTCLSCGAVGESGQHMYFARDGRSECVAATITFEEPRWTR